MFNRAKARDQQAIDEAKNGWWTASMKTHEQRIAWWQDARFGMFIHWGIYSLPAGEWKGKKVSGYAEHLMRKEKITRVEYLELAHTVQSCSLQCNSMGAAGAGRRNEIPYRYRQAPRWLCDVRFQSGRLHPHAAIALQTRSHG